MNCYYCEKPILKHGKKESQNCLMVLTGVIQAKTGLDYDDMDSLRHPKDIVEACIKEHNLGIYNSF